MKVWQYTAFDASRVGGVERHIHEVSAALERVGHTVHIGLTLPREWSASKNVIVHTHGDLWPNPTKLRGKTWIHVCHGTSIGRLVACREFLSISGWKGSARDFIPTRFADAAIAVGPHALLEARRYFRMRLPATVISNGANADIFAPLRQLSSASHLIYAGRGGDRVKNIDNLLEACRHIAKEVDSLELRAAPGFDHDPRHHSFVRNLGPLYGKALASAMAECRALVLCSYYEGDPLVLHEAQAMGLPVIVSDIPQLRRALSGYANAIFVNPRSIDSIASGIRNAVTGPMPVLTPRLRTWDQVAREFVEFYEQIIHLS